MISKVLPMTISALSFVRDLLQKNNSDDHWQHRLPQRVNSNLYVRCCHQRRDHHHQRYDYTIQRLQIHKRDYTNIILKRFNMENSPPASLYTHDDGIKFCKSTDELTPADQMAKQHWRTLAAKCTTYSAPDPISHTQSRKSRHFPQIHRPATVHETAAKKSLRYLNETRNFGISSDGSKGLGLGGIV